MPGDQIAEIKIISALACEDIREDSDGKLIAIGILAPAMELTISEPLKSKQAALPIALYFLLVVNFLSQGDAVLRFRVKAPERPGGRVRRKSITVPNPAKNVPLRLGPFLFTPRPGDTGFDLAFEQNGRWRTIGEWRFQVPVPNYEGEE